MYELYIGGVLFPVTPGKITIKVNSNNKTITLINEGEVNLIKTPGLTDITIDELVIPAFQKYPFALYEGKFHRGKYYLNKLEKWKKKKKPVQFKLTRTTPNGKNLLFDTNFDVTIEDYDIIEDAVNQGMDFKVKLSMKEYRYWGIKKVVVKNDKKSSKKVVLQKKKTRKTKDTAKSYIVKSGDCLYNIARKQLNDASKWQSIYELNKKTIEAAARDHGRKSSSNGHWICPGTKLKLPN